MQKIKKFGTFAGVFTPSILTILGVIMYMRLGWVVGQAGLLATLGIILIAHIISVTTGLSISSIATDKKIKAGGIYYILSRSLGLPMGGAIGITLFVGTALSISLYIIGFCENFLSIDTISNFIGLAQDLASFRILGSIVIVILVILAFISTDLAIKTQFFILIAIGLSLLSILLGFFTNSELQPAVPLISAAPGGLPLTTLFAIFFPAVTGFTAGVAMSGDLKDPKQSIPKGTLASIGVGLLVYIVLAFGFAYFVNRDLLLQDKNFLMRIAWFTPLVVAGIWGATLSSALGGILGAPRIMQAIAKDKLAPAVFAKGYGLSAEPRNALIFTYLIAEAGILIGELDVIARIVSMFYIAAYGFINLAYALESWASSDFRPSYPISRWVGITGFIASFAVMFKLDTGAMVIAFVIIMGIYFFLKRKEMHLEFGDVWQSVWSTLTRTSLSKMESKQLEKRNWQPNIILFGGPASERPQLHELAHQLAARHGFVTNFDFIPTAQQPNQHTHDSSETIAFPLPTRQINCDSVHEGIEQAAKYYGFTGLEPNTLMLGIPQAQSKNLPGYTTLIQKLAQTKYNLLLPCIHSKTGFGNYKTIDIWWSNQNGAGHLALFLAKFITQTTQWQQATLRLFIPLSGRNREALYKQALHFMESMRVPAEIRIIPDFSPANFETILRVESIHTDLSFLPFELVAPAPASTQWIEQAHHLSNIAGSIAFLAPSSSFQAESLIASVPRQSSPEPDPQQLSAASIQIESTGFYVLDQSLETLQQELTKGTEAIQKAGIKEINPIKELFLESLNITQETLSHIEQQQDKNLESNILIRKFRNGYLLRHRRFLEHLETHNKSLHYPLTESIDAFLSQATRLPVNLPATRKIKYQTDQLHLLPAGCFEQRIYKNVLQKFRLLGIKSWRYPVHQKHLFQSQIPVFATQLSLHCLEEMESMRQHALLLFQQQIEETVIGFEKVLGLDGEKRLNTLHQEGQKAQKNLQRLINNFEHTINQWNFQCQEQVQTFINELAQQLKFVHPNAQIDQLNPYHYQLPALKAESIEKANWWYQQRTLNFNRLNLSLSLLALAGRVESLIQETDQEMVNWLDQIVKAKYEQRYSTLESYFENPENSNFPTWEKEDYTRVLREPLEKIAKKVRYFSGRFTAYLEVPSNNLTESNPQPAGGESIRLSVSQLLDAIIQKQLSEPLEHIFLELQQKLEKADQAAAEVLRHILFISEPEGGIPSHFSARQNEQLKEQLEQLRAIQSKIPDLQSQFHLKITERISAFTSQLGYHNFVHTGLKGRDYLRQMNRQERISRISEFRKKSGQQLTHLFNQLWYRQSEGFILAHRLREKQNSAQTGDLLHLMASLSPRQKVLKQLPSYYLQLFQRKQYFLDEFFFGRQAELQDGWLAIQQHKNGQGGAILTSGDPDSGKSFYNHHLARKHFQKDRIFTITPPYEGSVNPLDFHTALQNAFEQEGTRDQLFQQLPEQSVVLVNSLELWWEKSAGGLEVLHELTQCIQKHGKRTLFIINCDTHSFKVINQMLSMAPFIIAHIQLQPMNAETLRDVVLKRHQSSGLGLSLEGKHFGIRPWQTARLFSRYFNYTAGNPGTALDTWLNHLVELRDNQLTVSTPKTPNKQALHHLETDWYLWLIQLLLHRRMTIEKMARVCLETTDRAQETLNTLQRAGFIRESAQGVWEIDRHLMPHLLAALRTLEMI